MTIPQSRRLRTDRPPPFPDGGYASTVPLFFFFGPPGCNPTTAFFSPPDSPFFGRARGATLFPFALGKTFPFPAYGKKHTLLSALPPPCRKRKGLLTPRPGGEENHTVRLQTPPPPLEAFLSARRPFFYGSFRLKDVSIFPSLTESSGAPLPRGVPPQRKRTGDKSKLSQQIIKRPRLPPSLIK